MVRARQAQRPQQRFRLRRGLNGHAGRRTLLALILLQVVAGGVVIGLRAAAPQALPDGWVPAEDAVQRQQQAADAAREFVGLYYTANLETLDSDLDRVIGASGGDLRERLVAARAGYRRLVQERQWRRQVTVREVGLEQITARRATVLVAADVVTSTSGVPRSGVRSRDLVDRLGLAWVGDSWQVVELGGAGWPN